MERWEQRGSEQRENAKNKKQIQMGAVKSDVDGRNGKWQRMEPVKSRWKSRRKSNRVADEAEEWTANGNGSMVRSSHRQHTRFGPDTGKITEIVEGKPRLARGPQIWQQLTRWGSQGGFFDCILVFLWESGARPRGGK